MKCIKTKRFLFLTWKYVEHRYGIYSISKFMDCSETFHVTYKCFDCGLNKTSKFIEPDELILMGVDVAELNKVDGVHSYYPPTTTGETG